MIQKTFQSTDEETARYAYHLWEAEGRIHGRDMDYWLQAQAHLKAHREYESKLLATPKKPTTQNAVVNTPEPKSTKQRRQNRSQERAYA